MSKDKKEKKFIKRAYYRGGPKATAKFIKENLIYPKEARDEKVEGTVIVRYSNQILPAR